MNSHEFSPEPACSPPLRSGWDYAPLVYGTTGFRAPVGPGPRQMNVTQVTRLIAGFASWLSSHTTQHEKNDHSADYHGSVDSDEAGIGRVLHASDRPIRVVVGYDARYGSPAFAHTAAEVCAGAGFEVTLLPTASPTPLIPWLITTRGLDGGVQITASHNPAVDNGCKIYTRDGRLLSSDAAAKITDLCRAISDVHTIPRVTVRPSHDQIRRYVDYVVELIHPGSSDVLAVATARAGLTVVYTAMHGVGGRVLHQCLQASGFALAYPVLHQQYPDPTFPTIPFPDPDEDDAVAAVVDLAAQKDADIIIAIDPDADRCSIGIKTSTGGHRMLSADELGPLLAHRLLSGSELDSCFMPSGSSTNQTVDSSPAPVVATTRVSSHLLAAMARARGWDYYECATGFKNLLKAADSRPGELAFAYEEAHGFCVDPARVPDKDGIATALVVCAWAADLKNRGSSIEAELNALQSQLGPYASGKLILRTSDPHALLEAAAATPPTELGGISVRPLSLLDDQAFGLSGASPHAKIRVLARASGTERKAKIYVHISRTDSHAEAARLLAAAQADLRSFFAQL